MSSWLPCLCLLVFMSGSIADTPGKDAPDPKQSLKKLMTQYRYPLKLEDGKLRDKGGEFLVRQAGESRFVVLGEAHNRKEIPAISTALFQQIQPAGFNYVAVETGTVTARKLNELLKQPDSEAAARTFLQHYMIVLPFYDQIEEFRFLKAVAAKGSAVEPIWGLDQEFFYSPRFLLDRMASLVKDPENRKIVEAQATKAHSGALTMMQKYMQTGKEDDSTVYIKAATDADIAQLQAVAAKETNPEVREIASQLAKTRGIYNPDDWYDSHTERLALFKTNFARYFREATARDGKEPRVMIKLGANHAIKGHGWSEQLDFGNFAFELAAFRGEPSFNVYMMARKFVYSDGENEYLSDNAYYPYMLADTAEDQSWVFDLTQIRKRLTPGQKALLDRESLNMIYGYDAYVIVPKFHESTPFVPLP